MNKFLINTDQDVSMFFNRSSFYIDCLDTQQLTLY